MPQPELAYVESLVDERLAIAIDRLHRTVPVWHIQLQALFIIDTIKVTGLHMLIGYRIMHVRFVLVTLCCHDVCPSVCHCFPNEPGIGLLIISLHQMKVILD